MIQINEKDTVAVAVEDCVKGIEVVVNPPVPLEPYKIIPVTDIPYGHKIALKDVPCGEIIIKYGKTIGKASKDIKKGELVSVHNIEGLRGRGDLRGGKK
ncbi:MAG: UxaA family hydrolase [Acetivibrionales bacterium]|jgi:altronate dehydratase small subunit